MLYFILIQNFAPKFLVGLVGRQSLVELGYAAFFPCDV